ncbi:MAG: GNAT family N-acetyltransferase [Nitrospiraceae bacterium]|nr:GNAT family N-acetyltransferase [Nitrospiraceae bacterium]
MDFAIRPARADDIPQMCDFLAELFSIESDFSPDRGKQARGLELLLSNAVGSSIVLVAEKGDEIVGMCSVQALISTAEGGPVGLLEDLVVKKDHRGKGIGKRLLSEILGWCAGKNISRIQLLADVDNERALNFYAGNGWADTNLVCMRKML